MTLSLGARISLGTVVATAVVVAIATTVVWLIGSAKLERTLDERLGDRLNALARLVHAPPDGVTLTRPAVTGRPPAAEFLPDGGWVFLQLVAADGTSVARTPSLAEGASLPALAPGLAPGEKHDAVLGGRHVRITTTEVQGVLCACGPLTIAPGSEATLAGIPGAYRAWAAIDATDTRDDLRRMAIVLAGVWGAATVLSLLVGVWLRRAVLGPVERISQAIQAIDPSNLAGRVPADGAPTELTPVLDRLNALLSRVEESMVRERSIITNVAHELRNPIAGLRTTLEVALAEPPEARGGAERTCLRVLDGMQAMVASLLALARIEAGMEKVTTTSIDAVALARGCWETLAGQAGERSQRAKLAVSGIGVVTTARDKLLTVLTNIFANAIQHAPTGSTIDIDIGTDERGLLVRCANPTDGSLTDTSRVFDAFWRGDVARTGGERIGLGLALVRRIVLLLGGTVEAVVADGRFTLTIRLPDLRDGSSAAHPAVAVAAH